MDGFGRGDVIIYQGRQREESIVLFWASILRGGIFVPLDDGWPDYLVRRVASGLNPRAVVAASHRGALYRDISPAARHISLMSDQGASEDPSAWAPWLAAASGPSSLDEPPETSPQDAAAYLFTSGSTDVPKAVVLSRGALATGAQLTVNSFKWQAGERLVNLPEPHTMSGLRNGFIAAPLAGVSLQMLSPQSKSSVFGLLDELAENGCQRLVAGPLLIRQLSMLADRVNPDALSALKSIYCTGAALNPSAVEAFFARFAIPVINYYGLTETGGICVSQAVDGWSPNDRSLGVAAGAELRVVDGDGPPAKSGVGELQVRSGQLMTGYLGDPVRTAARFVDGWLKTGDRVRLDEDGRCYLVGRLDGFLKGLSTDRIAPEEIEAVLEEHYEVAEAAVLGVKADDDVERVAALVVLRQPSGGTPSVGELAAFVRDRLGAARTPTRIQIVERLPRRDSGKIIRSELAALLHDT
jgi:acyl-coenzyme A synthetase/AMP-(fatty) acid ligase